VTYFPAATDFGSAVLMNLHAGEEIRDVNITTVVGNTVRVRVSLPSEAVVVLTRFAAKRQSDRSTHDAT
jgi:hypothetical protein